MYTDSFIWLLQHSRQFTAPYLCSSNLVVSRKQNTIHETISSFSSDQATMLCMTASPFIDSSLCIIAEKVLPDSNNNCLSKFMEHAPFNSPNMFSRIASLVSGWLNPLSKAQTLISIYSWTERWSNFTRSVFHYQSTYSQMSRTIIL